MAGTAEVHASSATQLTILAPFTGDENRDGSVKVEYGTDATWGNGDDVTACASSTGGSPRVCWIPKLTASTTYYIRVTYTDPDGVSGTAVQTLSIATAASGSDNWPPTLSIIKPMDGGTVAGNADYPITIDFTVYDASGISTNPGDVQVIIDGTAYNATVHPKKSGYYTYNWSTPFVGHHSVTAKAKDTVGNIGYAPTASFYVNSVETNSNGIFTGDGTLLVRDNDNQICQDCHKGIKPHSSASTGAKYGNWSLTCRQCHTPHNTKNIFLIREQIKTPNSGLKTVDFRTAVPRADTGPNSDYSFTNRANPGNGPCEVCHTRTGNRNDGTPRYRNTGTGPDNTTAGAAHANPPFTTNPCIKCHSHKNGFAHGPGTNGKVTDCLPCHGHDPGYSFSYNGTNYTSEGRGNYRSHSTHTENDADDRRGPNVFCDTCHDINNMPFFKTGTDTNGDGKYSLDEASVCANCHSEGGAYNGVNTTGSSVGAKENFKAVNGDYANGGVYNTDGTLKTGKEKWCAGCHDDAPSTINGKTAPTITGDNSTYGFFVNGHGREGANYPKLSWQDTTATGNPVAQRKCYECHDTTFNHIGNSDAGTPRDKRLKWWDTAEQANKTCKQCHDNANANAVAKADPQWFTTYTDWQNSAHGSTAKGNLQCVKCHEPHGMGGADKPAMTRDLRENLCYNCHTGDSGAWMNVQNNAVSGPDLATSIKQAFNLGVGGKHPVAAYKAFQHSGKTYNLTCISCHNIHLVTGKYWEADQGKSPLTKFSNNTAVWGASSGQKMNDYAGTGKYVVPTWDSNNGANFSATQMPDYPSFCLDCHGQPDPGGWTSHDASGGTPPASHQGIDWVTDPHGKSAARRPDGEGQCPDWRRCGDADGWFGYKSSWILDTCEDFTKCWPAVPVGRGDQTWTWPPYKHEERISGANFTLACINCHEAHGSIAPSMIRSRLNDKSIVSPEGVATTAWQTVCTACHQPLGSWHSSDPSELPSSCGTGSCHDSQSIHRMDKNDVNYTTRTVDNTLVFDFAFEENLDDSGSFRQHGKWANFDAGRIGSFDSGKNGRAAVFGPADDGVEPGTRTADGANAWNRQTWIFTELKFNGALELWIYPTSDSDARLYNKPRSTIPYQHDNIDFGGYTLTLTKIDGRLRAAFKTQIDGNGTAQDGRAGIRGAYSTVTIPLNTWTHMAATFDTAGPDRDPADPSVGRIRIYVNGIDVTTSDPSGEFMQPGAGEDSMYAVVDNGQYDWNTAECVNWYQQSCLSSLRLGFEYWGRMDDARLWNVTKPASYFAAYQSQAGPYISSAEGAVGSNQVKVTFSEGVYTNTGMSGALTPGDFTLTDTDNGRTVTGVTHTAGSSVAWLTLSSPLDATGDIAADTVAAQVNDIYDKNNLAAGTAAVTISAYAYCPADPVTFNLNEASGSAYVFDGESILAGLVYGGAAALTGSAYSGDGAGGRYIRFADNDACLQATNAMTIDARFKPAGLSGVTGAYIGTILSRNGNNFADNYDLLVWRDPSDTTNFPGFAPPDGIASIYLGLRPDDYHGGASWKVALSDYAACPIQDNRWYKVKAVWNSAKTGGIPADIYVDDQGSGGDDAGEAWSGWKNCTNAGQSYNADNRKLYTGDTITAGSNDFAVGTLAYSLGTYAFNGLIDWVTWKQNGDAPFPPNTPTMGTPTALSPNSIRWNFTDNSFDEAGFRLHNPSHVVKMDSLAPNVSYLDETGLTPNTNYTRHVHAYNAAGDSAASGDASIYTLGATPSVTADKTVSTWYTTPDVTFTNAAGFGAGKVQYYRYAWDQNASYVFNDTETQWSSGSLTRTSTTSGSWYLHLRSYNGADVGGPPINFGPYNYDVVPPSVSGMSPLSGATGVAMNTDVTFTLSDPHSGVDWTSFSITLTGNGGYSRSYTDLDMGRVFKTGPASAYSVTVNPDPDFGANEVITVTVNASDFKGNVMPPAVWSFTTSNNTLPSGVVSYWALNDGAGLTALDSTGPNNGALTNGPTWTTGKKGGGLALDGVNDYVNVPYNATLNLAEMTVEAWANSNTYSGSNTRGTNNYVVLSRQSAGGALGGYELGLTSDKKPYFSFDGASVTSWRKLDNSIPAASDTTGSNGRLPLGTAGTGDDVRAFAGTVMKDGATWKMWYSGHDGTSYRIYHATSTDGLVWTKVDNSIPAPSDTTGTNGRLPLGTAGRGDSLHAFHPKVVKDGATYKMWYVGNDGTNGRIFYATSTDGLAWTKQDNSIPAASDTTGVGGRIPLGTSGTGDDQQAYFPAVIKDGAVWKMWYTGHDGANARIFYATSADGLTWTKQDNSVPAASDTTGTNGRLPLGNDGKGDDVHAAYPAVILDGGVYRMWYSGQDGASYRIYTATSSDGLTWTKADNAIPAASDASATNGRLPLGSGGTGDDSWAFAPTVVKDGSTYRMWYGGSDGANYRSYYAELGAFVWNKLDTGIPAASDTSGTNGRLPLGTAGKGDSARAIPGTTIKDGATWKMWYTGFDGTNYRIYHATSPDGLVWTKVDNSIPAPSDTTGTNGRVPIGTAGKGDSANAYFPRVVKDGATYKMWYAGHTGTNARIYYATSPDGMTWTKYDNSIPAASDTTGANGRIPLGTSGTGDDISVNNPTVIKDGSTWKIWYMGNDGTNARIYHATSPDGLTWTKYDNSVPAASDTTGTNGRLPLGTDGTGDDLHVSYPAVIKDGTIYRMWYGGNDGSTYRVYAATSPDGLTWSKTDNAVPGMAVSGRLPLGLAGSGDSALVYTPVVVKDGPLYRMWYGGQEGTSYRGYYAEMNTGVAAPAALASGWHHLAGTRGADNTLRLYVDGVEAVSGGTAASDATGDGGLVIGDLFKGTLDEVVLYNRALSATEVGDNYDDGVSDAAPPSISGRDPAGGDVNITPDHNIAFTLSDGGRGVNWNSVAITLSGDKGYSQSYLADAAQVSKTGTAASYNVTIDPAVNFGVGEVITATVYAADSAGNVGVFAWSFTSAARAMADGAAAYWALNDGAGAIAVDSAGTNDGLLINGPAWTAGIVGGALSFDGADDYVSVADSYSWDVADMTVEAMVNLAAPPEGSEQGNYNRPVISRHAAGSAANGWELGVTSDGKPYFTYEDFSVNNWSKKDNSLPANSDGDSTNGRIPTGTAGKGDSDWAVAGPVIKDGGVYKMWYTGWNNSKYGIYYATSPDGLNWSKYDNSVQSASDTTGTNGRIPAGTAGKGDAGGSAYPGVIKDGGTYKMWYSGYDGFKFSIYYATSPDGLTWTKYNNTAPPRSNATGTNGRLPLGTTTSAGDYYGASKPSVIKDEGTYRMWYQGDSAIYHATSPDGLTWTKYDNSIPAASDTTSTAGRVPFGTSGKGDDAGVGSPTVIKDGEIYRMWYGGYNGSNGRIYYATSPDGLTWTKFNNTTPSDSNSTGTYGRLPKGAAGSGEADGVGGIQVIKEGSVYKAWYTGSLGLAGQRVYHATMSVGATGATAVPSGWHHLLGKKGSDGVRLFVDGNQVAWAGTSVADVAGDSGLRLGSRFGGTLDEVIFYRRALSTSEIAGDSYAGDLVPPVLSAMSPATDVWTKVDNSVPADSDTTSTNGRLPLGTDGKGDDVRAIPGTVIKDGLVWKMWYTGYDGTNNRIYHATSTDGLVWTKVDNSIPAPSDTTGTNGRIPLGTAGKGDSVHAYYPTVIKDGTTWKMWYAGHDGTNARIYHATSTDGLVWTKVDNSIPAASDTTGSNGRIPSGTDGRGDDLHAYYSRVIKDGGTYRMWYTGHDGTNARIYYAASPDGLTWTKQDNSVPANSDTTATNGRLPLGNNGKGDDAHAAYPYVIKDGNVYRMWYAGQDGSNYRVYTASSSDGLTWSKQDNTIPAASDSWTTGGRLSLGSSGAGDDSWSFSPVVVRDGTTYRMWYGGGDGTNFRGYYATANLGGAAADGNLTFTLTDPYSGVNWNSFSLQLSGDRGYSAIYTGASPQVSKTGSAASYSVTVNPAADFAFDEVVTVTLSVGDKAGNNLSTGWAFAATNGDISHWPFSEGTDGYTADSLGNNHGLLANGPAWTTGKNGGGLGFDGVDDHVEVDNVESNATLNVTNLSIEAWASVAANAGNHTRGTDNQVVLSRQSAGSVVNGYELGVTADGKPYLTFEDASVNNWAKLDNTIPAASDTTSTNGRIPLGTADTGDGVRAIPGTVVKDGLIWKMWYTGYDGTNNRIYYATSTDGLVWTKGDNSIPAPSDTTGTNGCVPLGTAGKGDSLHAYYPSVVKDGATWKMWYAGHDGTNARTYHATSPDGLTWTKQDNSVPAASDAAGTNGRIPTGTGGAGDDLHAYYPSVIKDGSIWKMWYTGHDGTNARIYHAVSFDGLNWVKYDNSVPSASDTIAANGMVPLGTGGRGDDTHAAYPVVVKDGGVYRMWYSGNDGSNYRVYYATSYDGLTWSKYDNSVSSASDTTGVGGRLPLGTTGGDTANAIAPRVVKDGPTYRMWYGGHDGANYRTYYAGMNVGVTASSAVGSGWHHLVGTKDSGGALKIYVDGAEVASGSTAVSVVTGEGGLVIGDLFMGTLDEVYLYGRALTLAEVLERFGSP